MLEGEEYERERLAKDLHDGLGGRLTAIKMNLENQSKISGNPSIEEQVKSLDLALQDLRATARNLMPETLMKFGLKDALKDFCLNMQRDGQKISFYSNNLSNISDKNSQLGIFRIIQELVNNAVKHSAATEILVQCTLENNQLLITVEDNGKGFNPISIKRNIGMNNIEKRVKMLDGTINIDSEKDKGTIINIECKV